MPSILQHPEVLALARFRGVLQPTTIQIAPVSYTSAEENAERISAPWQMLEEVLEAFWDLRAKTVVFEVGAYGGDPTDYEYEQYSDADPGV